MEMNPDSISLNGNPHPLDQPTPVDSFLSSIGFAGKPVVVELNEHPVFPRDYSSTLINPGDKIEIVALAAGG